MLNKYIDQLADLKHKESTWKVVSVGLFVIVAIQALSLWGVASRLVNNIDRVRYILSPGIQSLTTVRPGQLSEAYIEQT